MVWGKLGQFSMHIKSHLGVIGFRMLFSTFTRTFVCVHANVQYRLGLCVDMCCILASTLKELVKKRKLYMCFCPNFLHCMIIQFCNVFQLNLILSRLEHSWLCW